MGFFTDEGLFGRNLYVENRLPIKITVVMFFKGNKNGFLCAAKETMLHHENAPYTRQ